jgi:DNA primase
MQDTDLSLIEKIDISHIDIEHELAERGLAYSKTSGANLKAHCVMPNHQDSTPSAVISLRPNKYGLWYCNGCGASGNFFHLISHLDGVSYRDAVSQFFGDTTDIDFLLKTAIQMLKKKSQIQPIKYRTINMAKFHALSKPTGRGLKYLQSDKRKLTPETIAKFCLRQIEKGKHKQRIAIPYYGKTGKILTVKTRTYLPDNGKRIKMLSVVGTQPKPSLYGLYDSIGNVNVSGFKGAENEAILVEGEFDAMYMQQNNYRAYGLGSTSISSNQIADVVKNFDHVYVALDSDMFDTEEKRKVMKRLCDKLAAFIQVTVVRLPDGQDPNSMTPKQLDEVFGKFFANP